MDIFDDIIRTFRQGSVLTRLIYINIGLYLCIKLTGVGFFLAGYSFSFTEWFSTPSDLNELIKKPWTFVSYMFYHEGFLHLLFNILGLYWFGKLFLYKFEGTKLLSVYLIGGIWGSVLYVFAYNVFPVFELHQGLLLGASASIFAILVAIAVYEPNYEIYLFFIGKFPLKYIALFYVILSVIGISSTNPGGNLAHLGGAFWGWFYIYNLKRGKDWGYGMMKLLDKFGKLFSKKEKMKVTYKSPPRDDYSYNRMKNTEQEEINRILEKIKKSGYDSLSKQEKETLFKQGN